MGKRSAGGRGKRASGSLGARLELEVGVGGGLVGGVAQPGLELGQELLEGFLGEPLAPGTRVLFGVVVLVAAERPARVAFHRPNRILDSMVAPAPQRREYLRFAFHKVSPAWRSLEAEVRIAAVVEVEGLVARYAEGMMVRPYSTVGMRADTDLCFWTASHELGSVQDFARDFSATALGRLSENTHSFLSMTKRSTYLDEHVHPGQERLHIKPSKAKYVFVYPFVKTRQWYLLPKAERQRVMDEHIAVGHRYPSVKINTTYSFGLDDQDFVVAFETNEPPTSSTWSRSSGRPRAASTRCATPRSSPV